MTSALIQSIHIEIQSLIPWFLAQHCRVVTAESCTGGLLSSYMTAHSGSSAWFDRGFVTYSNEAKVDMLGVSNHDLKMHGAVSEVVSKAMAKGALQQSLAQCAFSITGIAGPTGGSIKKPVGTVYMAVAWQEIVHAHCFHFEGDREAIRHQACLEALRLFKMRFVQA